MTASQSGTGSSSSAVRDRLSVLAHCAKGGTVSFGPPRPQPKAAQVAATPDSLLTPMVGPAAAAWVPQALELPEAEEAASGIGAEVEYEELPQHQTSRYLGQYFGNCIPRLDGSSERPSLAGKLRSGEPRAKSYAPAKTLGEAVAPCYVHPPKWSFGGGKSRSTTLSATDGGSHSVGSFASLKRRPKRTLSRGFGTGGRTSLRPSSESPGPGTYDLFRVGDEVPVWASGSRLPWGTRTGGRTKLVHSASEVGPGEYTAEHGLVPAGPTAKIGQKIKDLPDSRINYPAPGHYPVKGTVAQKKPYQKGCDSPGIMGSGQRSTLSGKDEGPGFVYSPGVEASSHAQTWAQGERKSWLDADPDEPPGPGAYDPQDSLDAYNGKRSGWPKDEKQHRKMAGLLPADNPGPDYHVPLERIGWKIGFRGRLAPPKEEQRVSPDAYHPNTELVTYCAGVPRPLHRTAERRSIFDVGAGGNEGAAEALFKSAMKSMESADDGDTTKLSQMYESTTPSWSFLPRRAELQKKPQDQCANMYGPWSSFG